MKKKETKKISKNIKNLSSLKDFFFNDLKNIGIDYVLDTIPSKDQKQKDTEEFDPSTGRTVIRTYSKNYGSSEFTLVDKIIIKNNGTVKTIWY